MNAFQKYLSTEIGIEYKACLYFFAIVFYCCVYQLFIGNFTISILYLAEIILATYGMCYIQVYFLKNFDESEQFGVYEGGAILGCTLIYSLMSWIFGWFNHNLGVTIGFTCYAAFMYVCMFAVNKVKRDIDTRNLNSELEQFKKQEENRE